ncbi:MAG: hypothetical protein FWF80_03935 [Defluviitaleaceae bacterium]|nr:hypothetical protein [Defluviitaleaceae bacterium]
MNIPNWGIHNVPTTVLERWRPKLEKLAAKGIPPESPPVWSCPQNGLTDEQLLLREMRREFERHQPLPSHDHHGNKIDWANNPIRILRFTSGAGNELPVPPSTPAHINQTNLQQNLLSSHSEKMVMLKSWLRQAEILNNTFSSAS